MPPTNPRIVVVDDNTGLYNIVRASLELLGRRPRLIETHTGDDALTEIRIGSPDLLITAHSLSGTTNGPMLALLAKRELAALPILVFGNENDPEMDEETLSQSPFQYLRQPCAPEAFIRAIRIALDGPEAVPQEAAHTDFLGPVPTVDTEKLRALLFTLMRDVGAMAAVLADRNGKVINFEGAAGYIDRDLLAAALAPGFTSTPKLTPVIGNQPRILKYFDGEKGGLFGLAVGLHYFIMLIFEGNAPAAALGNVKRYGGNSVNEMLNVIGLETAFSIKPVPVASVVAEKTEPAHGVGKRKRGTQELSAVKADAVVKAATSTTKKVAEPEPPRPQMEPIVNFDPSLLDALDQVDLNAADDLFSPERMAASSSAANGNKISFEDALLQGIIGDVDE
ncbi:MAG: hypothetical protein ABI947_28340 [Chloroflexota bacterium]